jgi:hypothetical protein
LIECLKVIASVDQPEKDQRCEIIVDKDGFHSLTILLQRYSRKASMLHYVMTALCRLASAEKYADKAIEAGVPQDVITCIQLQFLEGKFISTFDDVLGDAILLLGNLSYNADARVVIREHGGIRVMLQIMASRKESAEILDHCCYSLANLCYASNENMEQIVECKLYFFNQILTSYQ